MKIFRAIKTVEFDYGHRVPKHDSKCRNAHGHRGKLEVSVEGTLVTEGSSTDMVMDFGHIKRLVEEEIVALLDHCFIIAGNDTEMQALFPAMEETTIENGFGPRYDVPGFGLVQELRFGAPTAEILAYACYTILSDKMPCGTKLVSVKFWETPNSVAEYIGTVAFGIVPGKTFVVTSDLAFKQGISVK